ncbi:MAG: hypothetical protein QOJ29_4955, partial [Thermoleophilaceae bacterium]|nr:hypothetical protein [Thermoleophilaceae bacterium]
MRRYRENPPLFVASLASVALASVNLIHGRGDGWKLVTGVLLVIMLTSFAVATVRRW